MNNYRQRVIQQYHNQVAEYVNAQFDCLDLKCNKRSDVEGALCGDCERQLTGYCSQIDKAIQWLTIMGEIETRNIAAPGGGDHFAKNGEATNLTPASLVADELDNLATRFGYLAMGGMSKPPSWTGYPGSYLATCAPYIAKQPWVIDLLYGYEYLEDSAPKAEVVKVRGLKAIFTEIRTKWSSQSDSLPPRALPGLPCPHCTNETLMLYPASYPGQPIAIVCDWKVPAEAMTEFMPRNAGCPWRCSEDAQNWLQAITDLYQKIATTKAI